MTDFDQSTLKESDKTLNNDHYVPILEEKPFAAGQDVIQFQKTVRRQFLKGKRMPENPQQIVAPVLLASFYSRDQFVRDFPVVYDVQKDEISSLYDVLYELVGEVFDSDEADQLIPWIAHITHAINKKLSGDLEINYSAQVREIVSEFRRLKVDIEKSQNFEKQCEQIQTQLLAKRATLIGFSAFTAIHLLNLQLRKRRKRNQLFLDNLQLYISRLDELLLLHGDETDPSKNHFDFAGELISFDKIEDMTVPDVSTGLSEERLQRLRQSRHTLSQAHQSYSDSCCTIFVSDQLSKELEFERTMNASVMEIADNNSCGKARDYFSKEFDHFLKIIAALRLAELEVNNKYDEELHTSYFEGFDRSYLTDEDLGYFRSLIVVEDSRRLAFQPADFLGLLTEGAYIKVLAVNRLDEMHDAEGDMVGRDAFLELAALAIFRRNACVFQGGMHHPSWLMKVYNKGLDAACPAIWNVLVTSPAQKRDERDYGALKTAVGSRYFPHVEYDVRSGTDFGSRFDISRNPMPTELIPSFDQDIKTSSGKKINRYSLTPADFLAIIPECLEMMEVLPTGYDHPDLIPVSQYLTESQESVAGKIPVTWMVDKQNVLRPAVVPVSWLRNCRARLDYWEFLQELAGTQGNRVNSAITEAQTEWETKQSVEMEELKMELNAQFDRIRADDLEKAIAKILYAFLETDIELTELLKQPGPSQMASEELGETFPEPELVQHHEEVKRTVSSDAWVESDLCTSCSDCIDALPSVFEYNSDKLAVVHNPKGASYAKIVGTAEKCPARCIHPGMPHDSSEPGLEKLLERAEKYN